MANQEQPNSELLLSPPTLPTPSYLNDDLPSLTPSKPPPSVSDSESDSIPERFTDEDDDHQPVHLINSLSINPPQNHHPQPQRTPSSQTSLSALSNSHISLSEPVPLRNNRIIRKRSLSALVALRYKGGKGDSEIGDEERGLLALDLDTYINSGEPECIPETRALPPSALFPTLSTVLQGPTTGSARKTAHKSGLRATVSRASEEGAAASAEEAGETMEADGLLLPTPRSEWFFGGGTGPGKTSRGFIPGRSLSNSDDLLSPPLNLQPANLLPDNPPPQIVSPLPSSAPVLN